MEKQYFIGVDLGGTKISGILTDFDGAEMAKRIVPTGAEEGKDAVLARILDLISTLLEDAETQAEQIAGIGIGSPGAMDIKQGILIQTANLPFMNFNLVAPIKEKFGIPTYLDNDANVAALAEYTFGAGKGSRNMIFITVSTGIGGGAILNGRFYRGNTCNALEVGHITVEKDGMKCNCGNTGCAELYASGRAIGKAAQIVVRAGKDTLLSTYPQQTAYEVFQAAAEGDRVAEEILNKALDYLGICVANTATVFDPEVIVIGGGVAQAGQIVFDRVQAVVNARCLKPVVQNTRIVPAALGSDAGVVGAVALAIMESK